MGDRVTPAKKLDTSGLLGYGRAKPQAVRPVFVSATLEKDVRLSR